MSIEPNDKQQRGDTEPASQPTERVTGSVESSGSASFWRREWTDVKTFKGSFVLAVAAGLALLVLGPLVTPLPSIPARGIHAVYVFVSGQQDKERLKNVVGARPIWNHKPRLFDASFDSAVSDYQPLAETDDGNVTYHGVQEVFNDAVKYNGLPTNIVGRVGDTSTVSTETFAPLETEFQLVGTDRLTVAYVGVQPAGPLKPSKGEIVFARGVVVAVGAAKQIAAPTRRAIYFIALDVTDANTTQPTSPSFRRLYSQLSAHARPRTQTQ